MTPTAIAEFPKEMLGWPPRSYVNRIFNVKRWTKFSRGGHFAALEAPGQMSADWRMFLVVRSGWILHLFRREHRFSHFEPV